MDNQELKKVETEIEQLTIQYQLLENKLDKTKNEIEKLYEIYEKVYYLHQKLMLLKGPVYSNEKIDLYYIEKESNSKEEKYYINVHGTNKLIGYIRITLKSFNPYLGNIGYEINKEHRGHKYALQALELLRKPMITKGLTNIIITTYPDNLPSIKTIENFGGVLVKEANDDQNWNTYEVDLLNQKNQKK